MFLGLEWYWCLVIVVVFIIAIPFKVKFMKWWSKRQQEKKKVSMGNGGMNPPVALRTAGNSSTG